jgi:hypothetical protein
MENSPPGIQTISGGAGCGAGAGFSTVGTNGAGIATTAGADRAIAADRAKQKAKTRGILRNGKPATRRRQPQDVSKRENFGGVAMIRPLNDEWIKNTQFLVVVALV